MIPGSANPLLLRSAAPATYQVTRSLRFNSADSAYLSRTPGSAGSRTTWTVSFWCKRSNLGTNQCLFITSDFATTTTTAYITPSDTLEFYDYQSGAYTTRLITTQVFRDSSAWYHLVFAWDTNNGTSTDRARIYVNGTRVSTFGTATYPNSGVQSRWNNNVSHVFGLENVSNPLNGYLADVHLVDGQALTADSFGEPDATTGVWNPKAYTGTYGTNGFKLTFSDNSSNTSTTLGKDTSGNSNNWTPNNLSVTAGAGNDSLVDSPTNYGTDTGAGGEVRGNYCTWNPLDNGATLANGNLDFSFSSTPFRSVRSTFALSSGKWYWEATLSTIGGAAYIGIGTAAASLTSHIGDSNSWGYINDGKKQSGATIPASYGASYTTGDVIGVAFDADNGTLTFYKNGTSQGQAFSGLTSGPYFLMVTAYNGTVWATNFGQRPFAYTAPSGYKALCTANLPAPTIVKPDTVMDVKLYTGNSSTQTISGLGFSPDLVWIKCRSNTENHVWSDVVRGTNKFIYSDATLAEDTSYSNVFNAFNSDGFSLGYNSSFGGVNVSSRTYAAWCWDGGSSTVTNTSGSISSQVRANASAGFSVVSWTSDGSSSIRTCGHGLGVKPSLVIAKNRDLSDQWLVLHSSFSNQARNWLRLNTTDSLVTATADYFSYDSTTFGFKQNEFFSNGHRVIAYCFAPVSGYSAMGKWSGGSDAFVYLGFRPKWLLIKANAAGYDWLLFDSSRSSYNLVDDWLSPNVSAAEQQNNTVNNLDFLSNGFKIKGTGGYFGTSVDMLYIAFAEHPFQYARAR